MKPLTAALTVLLIVLTVAAFLFRDEIRDTVFPTEKVLVAHWVTGHLTRDGLLKEMAEEFNEAGHKIGSGKRIKVEVYDAPSELQGKYLSELLRFGIRLDLNEITNGYVVENIPDPTMVTPSSAHWLVTVNYEVKRDRPEVRSPVVNLAAAQSIVRPVIGIVTHREMAECLGWPQKKIGFADIIALRNDPQGWASYPAPEPSGDRNPCWPSPTRQPQARDAAFISHCTQSGRANRRRTSQSKT